MAPDAATPVERGGGSGSAATTAAAATLAVVVSPGDARPLRAAPLRSTSLALHLTGGQEVGLGQLGPDGQCHREVGVSVDVPVGL